MLFDKQGEQGFGRQIRIPGIERLGDHSLETHTQLESVPGPVVRLEKLYLLRPMSNLQTAGYSTFKSTGTMATLQSSWIIMHY